MRNEETDRLIAFYGLSGQYWYHLSAEDKERLLRHFRRGNCWFPVSELASHASARQYLDPGLHLEELAF